MEIAKIEDNIFRIIAKKTYCHYTNAMDCGCDEWGEEFTESIPKKNQELNIILNTQNNKRIKIKSDALKSKCEYAWDFRGMTFVKKSAK
ncbi:MAG: hypothetical protein ACKO6L_11625, partial [Flavobacteriales bacterium]